MPDDLVTCRVFIFSSHALWIDNFGEELRALDWQVKFALNLDEFKSRFVEAETDVLILRGGEDVATVDHMLPILAAGTGCGFIWMYPGGNYRDSPYLQIADYSVSATTSDPELIAIVQSFFGRLKRLGWR